MLGGVWVELVLALSAVQRLLSRTLKAFCRTLLDFKSMQSLLTGPDNTRLDNVILGPVPEPETYAMLLAGIGLIAAGSQAAQNYISIS